MAEPYDQMLAALRERAAFVHLDVQPPRNAPKKQFVASMFEVGHGEQGTMHPQGQGSSLAVTPEQARELLAAGAEWKGPAHMRAEVLPDT